MRKTSSLILCQMFPLLMLGLAASTTPVEAAPHVPFSKPAMLSNLTHAVIIPSYVEFSGRAQRLADSVSELKKSPDTNTLLRTQEAWRETMLAWKATQASNLGPTMETGLAHRVYYHPIRRASVDKILRDPAPIDAAAVENLGVSVIGLGTLEYLLFDSKGGDTAVLKRLIGEGGERRRLFADVLAAEVRTQGRAILESWKDASNPARKTFLAGGQESVQVLVNTLAFTVEAGVFARLRQMVGFFESNLTQPDYFEGGISGLSQRNMVAVLRSARGIYTGGDGLGLDDQVANVGSAIGPRLLAQFDATIKAFETMGGPIEKSLKSNKAVVLAAADECKKLEVMIKVDLTSALGVTLTFTSVDGD